MEHESETVTLKEYMMETMHERDRKYEQRFNIIDVNTKDALATANENIRGALAALDRRFELVNEFRAQLNDQQNTFARKAEIDISISAMNEKIDGVISQNIRNAGSGQGFNSAWVIFLGGTSLVATFIAVAFAMARMFAHA